MSLPDTEAAIERRKTRGNIERRGTRLSELVGSTKSSLMRQVKYTVGGPVIKLLSRLLGKKRPLEEEEVKQTKDNPDHNIGDRHNHAAKRSRMSNHVGSPSDSVKYEAKKFF